MERALLCLTFCLLASCGQQSESNESVYFSGEIVNPTSDYIVLYKDDKVVDSARLNKDNRFSFKLSNIEEGLHHFDHSPELQYVYLEKGDSLIIRLNTVAFDESLVFSGTNEEVNNFLLEMFLNYEDEEQLVYSYYQFPPEKFGRKIDSLRNQKLEELNLLKNSSNVSEGAFKMAKASIDYNSYIYKEKYPFIHKKKSGEETIHKLDASFYDYRKNLNLNDASLTYFRPYYNYVNNRFGNLSYMVCVQNCGMEKMMSSKDHLHLNKHKMHLIDSLVEEEHLRNNLFRNVAMNYLLKVHKVNNECNQFIDTFHKLSDNEAHIAEINHLYNGIKALQPNENVPKLVVQNTSGDSTSMKAISKDGKVVFYFWTGDQKRHFRNILRHVKKLEKKNPDYRFVGINLRTPEEKWLTMIEEHSIDKNSQYRSPNFEKAQEALIIDNLSKCIITKDTIIVDAFANVFTSKSLISK
ncbi:thioredoxin family protein [Croceitalea sp. MTPC9]|uniref:TlpA family protein disulfide reductase n=1 Tax=unclassified Croceitalea TaxID=2632280 RepID=UPI002B38CFF5|nr:thioredoxin family protein [Croceitalea sp. MTPC6]GMN15529.1 thioredoxin family protein [Croceitalea sp. MTPC9]